MARGFRCWSLARTPRSAPRTWALTKTFIPISTAILAPAWGLRRDVTKATLKLFISPGIAPSGTMDLYTVTGDWNEATLNPSSPPAISSSPFLAGIAVGQDNSFLVVDVTQLVQSWLKGAVNGGLENRGIALAASTSTTYVVFDSKESIITSHEPRLELCWRVTGRPAQQPRSRSALRPRWALVVRLP